VRGIPVARGSADDARREVHPISPALGLLARLGLFLLAIPASLLPRRVRRALPLERLPMVPAAVVSAMIQCAAALILAGHGFGAYREGAYGEGGGLGPADLLGFLLGTPLGLVVAGCFLESWVRFAAALGVGSVVGTLPLGLLDRGEWLARRLVQRLRWGPLVADELEIDGAALWVASCRPRRFAAVTLEYRNRLYHLVAEEHRPGRRRFAYRLEPILRHHLVRRIHYYSPDELLGWRDGVSEARAVRGPLAAAAAWLRQVFGRGSRRP
jgi:hypothetical protein